MSDLKKVAIVGGGAGGFFSAISVKKHHPFYDVHIFEKTPKLLSKVKVSGGGRCNVTHNQLNNRLLAANYPRGEKFLKQAFSQFSVQDTIDWFANQGVELKTEADNRMFPASNSSQTVIDTFLGVSQQLNIQIHSKTAVHQLKKGEQGFELTYGDGSSQCFDYVILALGGQKDRSRYELLSPFSVNIIEPVPSLFTFNIKNKGLTSLMGLSVPDARVKIVGQKHVNQGPLLITHWGVSGPAVLKLSSLAAPDLAKLNYHFQIIINWLGGLNENELRLELETFITNNAKKTVSKYPFNLPNRLWSLFLEASGISASHKWGELGKKSKNILINKITNDTYIVENKTTFKEEFVICGGVDLKEINPKTMEFKKVPGLFGVGEFLNIDGITGGFNFQAAWTTGFIAGKLNT